MVKVSIRKAHHLYAFDEPMGDPKEKERKP